MEGLYISGSARLLNTGMLLGLARQILLASYRRTPQKLLLASATVYGPQCILGLRD